MGSGTSSETDNIPNKLEHWEWAIKGDMSRTQFRSTSPVLSCVPRQGCSYREQAPEQGLFPAPFFPERHPLYLDVKNHGLQQGCDFTQAELQTLRGFEMVSILENKMK